MDGVVNDDKRKYYKYLYIYLPASNVIVYYSFYLKCKIIIFSKCPFHVRGIIYCNSKINYLFSVRVNDAHRPSVI